VDLWKTLLKLYRKHNVEIHWVEGHSNVKENERCDKLAVEASKQSNLSVDYGYEESGE
jgi:ribonuclease HI